MHTTHVTLLAKTKSIFTFQISFKVRQHCGHHAHQTHYRLPVLAKRKPLKPFLVFTFHKNFDHIVICMLCSQSKLAWTAYHCCDVKKEKIFSSLVLTLSIKYR